MTTRRDQRPATCYVMSCEEPPSGTATILDPYCYGENLGDLVGLARPELIEVWMCAHHLRFLAFVRTGARR